MRVHLHTSGFRVRVNCGTVRGSREMHEEAVEASSKYQGWSDQCCVSEDKAAPW